MPRLPHRICGTFSINYKSVGWLGVIVHEASRFRHWVRVERTGVVNAETTGPSKGEEATGLEHLPKRSKNKYAF